MIAVDIDPRKLEWAAIRRDRCRQRVDGDPVAAIQALTDGNGADVVIEAVGSPETYRQAFFARDLAGTLVQVGVPNPTMTIELPMIELFGRGGALKSSWYGDCLPSRDFPLLIDLYLRASSTSTASSPRPSLSKASKMPSRRCTAAKSPHRRRLLTRSVQQTAGL